VRAAARAALGGAEQPPCADVSRAASPAAALRSALQCSEVLHWAGHVGQEEGGAARLVISWRSDVVAHAEPGDSAAAFLASCRCPSGPPASLRALCASGAPFEAQGGVLHTPIGDSSHAHPHSHASESGAPGGSQPPRVYSALFSRTLPCAGVSAEQLAASAPPSLWKGTLLVLARASPVTAAPPPQLVLAAAALDAGCAAALLQLPREEEGSPAALALSERELSHFFSAFYTSLFASGEGEEEAIGGEMAERAERALVVAAHAAPSLASCFSLLRLRDGHLVASRPLSDGEDVELDEEVLPHPAHGGAGLGGAASAQLFATPTVPPATPRAASGAMPSSPRSSPSGDVAVAVVESKAETKRSGLVSSLFSW